MKNKLIFVSLLRRSLRAIIRLEENLSKMGTTWMMFLGQREKEEGWPYCTDITSNVQDFPMINFNHLNVQNGKLSAKYLH
jgi:hypothetical protein